MARHSTKDGVTILVDIPEGEKKETRHVQPSFVNACQGSERVANVLDYFVYAASKEVKEKRLEVCNVVTLTRAHEKILECLETKPSRKSLIRYLHTLNDLGYVRSTPYKKEFTVDLGAIQKGIASPPQAPARTRRLYEKSSHVTTLHTSEDEGKRDSEKVVMLQQKVDTLSKKVDELSTLQRDFEALQSFVQSHFSNPPVITSNRPVEESGDASAIASDITPTPPSSDIRIATTPEQPAISESEGPPTQDMLLPEASHPLSEDEWLEMRTRYENQLRSRWETCRPKQDIRAQHRTLTDFKKFELKAWDLRTPKPRKNASDALWAQVAPSEQEYIRRWFSLRKGAVITPIDVTGAQLLTESGLDLTAEQMRKERDWLRETQPNWFGFKGTKQGKVTLKDIAENAAAWLEIEERAARRHTPPKNVVPFRAPGQEEIKGPRVLTRSEREAILHPQGRVGAR